MSSFPVGRWVHMRRPVTTIMIVIDNDGNFHYKRNGPKESFDQEFMDVVELRGKFQEGKLRLTFRKRNDQENLGNDDDDTGVITQTIDEMDDTLEFKETRCGMSLTFHGIEFSEA